MGVSLLCTYVRVIYQHEKPYAIILSKQFSTQDVSTQDVSSHVLTKLEAIKSLRSQVPASQVKGLQASAERQTFKCLLRFQLKPHDYNESPSLIEPYSSRPKASPPNPERVY